MLRKELQAQVFEPADVDDIAMLHNAQRHLSQEMPASCPS